MRFKYLILIMLAAFSALGAQSISQQEEIPVEVFIGTPVKLHIDIASSIGDSIYAPMIDTVGVFQIIDRQHFEEVEGDTQHTLIDLSIAAKEPGEHTFPSLEYTLDTSTGRVVLRTEPFEIGVRSMLADSSNVVRDIASPLMIYPGFWDIFFPDPGACPDHYRSGFSDPLSEEATGEGRRTREAERQATGVYHRA